ncbi:MAG: viroplasmin family protein, partial [Sarcina sp.]
MVFLKDLKDEECFGEYYFSTEDTHNQWNIQGECEAAIGAVERALEMGCKEITIYYDYQGVGSWYDKSWKAKNIYTKSYVERMDWYSKKIKINMVKVKG